MGMTVMRLRLRNQTETSHNVEDPIPGSAGVDFFASHRAKARHSKVYLITVDNALPDCARPAQPFGCASSIGGKGRSANAG
jgi:hypothetical protein